MNRAERRRLQHAVKSKLRPGRLAHPVPESITLIDGPMDGWVVRPDAPALTPKFYEGLIEARAAGLYNASLSPTGETFAPPAGERKWADLSEQEREPFREQAREEHPPGRYMQYMDGPRILARWREGY